MLGATTSAPSSAPAAATGHYLVDGLDLDLIRTTPKSSLATATTDLLTLLATSNLRLPRPMADKTSPRKSVDLLLGSRPNAPLLEVTIPDQRSVAGPEDIFYGGCLPCSPTLGTPTKSKPAVQSILEDVVPSLQIDRM